LAVPGPAAQQEEVGVRQCRNLFLHALRSFIAGGGEDRMGNLEGEGGFANAPWTVQQNGSRKPPLRQLRQDRRTRSVVSQRALAPLGQADLRQGVGVGHACEPPSNSAKRPVTVSQIAASSASSD